ncbi:MAG: lysophospholipid acyltransferase family protein [Candidatus Omnitrophota bacterium]|nr:MAG: lysophospholipid acyltransferase family protein [Candidatus Omnitrophota bacterium]
MLYFLYRAGRSLCLKVPLKICYKAAVICADIYYLFARDDRRNLTDNLKVILGTDDKKLIERHIKSIFRNFAKYLADFFRFGKLNRDYISSNITIEGRENIDRVLAKGKGAIMLGAHIGNWEMGAAVIASLGYPFYAIVLSHKDKQINDFFVHQRSIADVKIIAVGSQLKNCFRVLKKNSLVAIVGDRDFSGHGVKADFFGRPAILPKGPAFFSLRIGSPIIPSFLLRMKDDTFKLVFEKPLEGKSTGNEEADIKNLMQKYLSVIEKYIKIFPDQWYAFKRVWT